MCATASRDGEEVTTHAGPVRFILRCRRCKTTTRVDGHRRQVVRRWWHPTMGMARSVGPEDLTLPDGSRLQLHLVPPCPGCGRAWSTCQRVKGHRVPEIPCGGKCRNAKGPNCDCSCGGENHGRGHAAAM